MEAKELPVSDNQIQTLYFIVNFLFFSFKIFFINYEMYNLSTTVLLHSMANKTDLHSVVFFPFLF
jgi:hypothetical protein